ncbi:MAG: helix-hairpin-helix domain-containing protein [Planctomycetaceae bacterium]|jgi:competence ComEA-like helix-hairpin-helix protein|nr:helix-hairpin-helix domain-containing protein [Planctomycetaceae bacterium]
MKSELSDQNLIFSELRDAEFVAADADKFVSPALFHSRDRVVIMFFGAIFFAIFFAFYNEKSRQFDDGATIDYQFYVDPNNAVKAEFQTLPGIGAKLSDNIINYRNTIKQFDEIDDLLNVHLIGKKKLDAIRPFVKIYQNPSHNQNHKITQSDF